MQYRQKSELDDLNGRVYWEFVISDNYSDLFNPNPIDVDVFTFGSVKREGETSDSKQKDDEFDFTINEASIVTADDLAAVNLAKSGSSSDVWIALFEHESENFTPCDFNDKVFSGLIRRKITGDDLIWYGDQWSQTPNPIRTLKESAQDFGSAIFDKINLNDKTDENGNAKTGLLNTLTMSDIRATTGLTMLNMRSRLSQNPDDWIKVYFETPCLLNDVIKAICDKAVPIIQKSIPGFELTYKATESGYEYALQKLYADIHKLEIMPDTSFRAKLLDFTDGLERQPIIDWQLILKKDAWFDTMPTVSDAKNKFTYDESGEALRWTRFETLTDLLYKIAICFGCVLRFKSITAIHLEMSFEPVFNNQGKAIYIIDSESANVDIQSAILTDADKYYAKASEYCEEGYDYCLKVEGDSYSEAYINKKNNETTKSTSTALPLSISVTTQLIDRNLFTHPGNAKDLQFLPQNTSLASNARLPRRTSLKKMTIAQNAYRGYATILTAWTGLIFKNTVDYEDNLYLGSNINQYYSFAAQVSTKINGQAIWYNSLSDCLNSRASANGEIFKTDYKITVPYIKGVAVNSDGSGASLKNLAIFDLLTIDGKEYTVRAIEIKPNEGKLELTISQSSIYGFFASIPPTAGKIVGKLSGEALYSDLLAGSEQFQAGETIESGAPIMINLDGEVINYVNIESNYRKFYGIAVTSAAIGAPVYIKRGGIISTDLNLTVPFPVYLRFNQRTGKCVISQQRLYYNRTYENIDIQIGKAVSEMDYELDNKLNEYLCTKIQESL